MVMRAFGTVPTPWRFRVGGVFFGLFAIVDLEWSFGAKNDDVSIGSGLATKVMESPSKQRHKILMWGPPVESSFFLLFSLSPNGSCLCVCSSRPLD